MAKQPITMDRFRIMCEAEAAEMGPIIAQLSRMGLTNVHFELITDVVRFGKNQRQLHDVKSQDVLLEWIKEHPTFRANEAVKHFTEQGRTASATYPALHVLVEKGVLKKLSPGNYSRTDVEAIEAPKKAKPEKVAKAKKKVVHEKPAAEFALSAFRRAHGRMSSATLKRHFEADGRAPTGVGPVLSRLQQEKKIRSVGEGMYEIIAPKKTEAKTKAKTNGAHAPAEAPADQGAVTNG